MNWYGSIARRLVWLMPLAFLMSACQTVDLKQVEAKVGETLPVVCAGIDVAWVGFQAYTSAKTVKPELLVKANASYFAAKAVCANPPTDTTEALIAAVKAYSAFKQVTEAAKNDRVSAGAPS